MATRLSVTNLSSTKKISILGLGTLAGSATKSREYSQIELDPMLAGLDAAAAAGWIRYRLSPGSRAVRSYAAVAAGTSPDAITWAQEDILVVDPNLDDVTVTLPPAASCAGKVLWVKRTDASNVLTLDGYSAETIDGAATMTVPASIHGVALFSNGTLWLTLHSEEAP